MLAEKVWERGQGSSRVCPTVSFFSQILRPLSPVLSCLLMPEGQSVATWKRQKCFWPVLCSSRIDKKHGCNIYRLLVVSRRKRSKKNVPWQSGLCMSFRLFYFLVLCCHTCLCLRSHFTVIKMLYLQLFIDTSDKQGNSLFIWWSWSC